jgi:peptidyl-dipeptidase Dcp
MWKVLRVAGLLLLASCAAAPKPVEPKRGEAVAEEVTPPKSEQEAARARVEQLARDAASDPMLAPWSGPYGGVPPWDRIAAEHFPPAFEKGIRLLEAEIAAIAAQSEPPTFANTIAALEDAGRHMDRGLTLFSVMTSNLNTKEVQAVDREWSPKITAAYDAIVFNEKLFARIAAVYDARDKAGLTPEQKRLVERKYDDFVRAGAKLSPEEKKRLGEINQELTVAFTDFGNKVLADEDSWVVIEKAEDLAGLPESLRASYKAAAEERKLPGKWLVVNTRSSVDPFLTFSSRRELREKVWKAFKSRGDNGNTNDTKALIATIVKLRAERAALLGYPSHAHWRMADTMAIDPAKAQALMLRVWPAAVARVREEIADMARIAKKEGAKITIEPWDYLYYSEKVRKAKYDLDQAELKPYFQLDNMIQASSSWPRSSMA